MPAMLTSKLTSMLPKKMLSLSKARWECPARAIKNAFIQRMLAAPDKISHCFNCLKACNPATAPYCITQALINAVVGDLDNGLIFCGSRVGEIREITTVPKLLQELTV